MRARGPRDLQREPGLAHAARPGQRQQPHLVAREQLADPSQVVLAPEGRRHRGRRAPGRDRGSRWVRIACSSSRSSRPGSRPSSSASRSRRSRNAQRVRVPAGTVEREHLLPAQPFAQRVLGDERLELARDVGVATSARSASTRSSSARTRSSSRRRTSACAKSRSRCSASTGPRHSARTSRSSAAASSARPALSSSRASSSPWVTVRVELARLDDEPVAARLGAQPVGGGPRSRRAREIVHLGPLRSAAGPRRGAPRSASPS